MWSYKKILSYWFLLTSILLSCGFQPLLDPNKNGKEILNLGKFSFFLPKDDISFKIKEELLKELGFPKNPTYKILADNDLKSVKSLITTENEIIRYNLILETTFKVISLQKNKEIYSKDFSSQTAYSAKKSVTGFATQTTKDSAKDRLAKDIANKILMELLIVRGDLFN
tara:strand:- start:213 stop:719 length:507 start_codon:yes stop_codon:yes gene_type:complete